MRRAFVPLLLLAGGALASPLTAQTTRSWEVCFQTGIGSCTVLELTTTATMVDGFRVGTDFGLRVRQTDGPLNPAAIWSISFAYQGQLAPADGAGSADGLVPMAEGGATPVMGPGGWSAWSQSSASDPAGNSLWLYNMLFEDTGLGGPLGTQAIGGCHLGLNGAIDPYGSFRTDLQTCGTTDWYAFAFSTGALLDADRFQSATVDLWTGTEFAAAFCAGPLSGDPGIAFDGVNLDGGSYTASPWGLPGGSDPSVVPEPATMTLLATGLVGLAATRRRRTERR